jgi:hypothetical protein
MHASLLGIVEVQLLQQRTSKKSRAAPLSQQPLNLLDIQGDSTCNQDIVTQASCNQLCSEQSIPAAVLAVPSCSSVTSNVHHCQLQKLSNQQNTHAMRICMYIVPLLYNKPAT